MPAPLPILMYHSISSEASNAFRRWAVAPDRFEEHMRYLRSEGYAVLTVSQLTEAFSNGSTHLPERPVVVTFDDGFADFAEIAVPILTRHAIPSTIYICTGAIGATSSWLAHKGEGNRRMMTWSQVAELPAAGIECGAHTVTHPQLDTLPHTEAWYEISRSKDDLEQHLGFPVKSFAYPHGYHSEHTNRMVQEAGYSSACAVKHAMSSDEDDHFALARIIVSADTDVRRLTCFLDGEGLPVAPYREHVRTVGWRLVRRSLARLQRTEMGA